LPAPPTVRSRPSIRQMLTEFMTHDTSGAVVSPRVAERLATISLESVPTSRSSSERIADERGPRVWWRNLPSSRRRLLKLLLAGAVLLCLVVGALLARYLSVENVERHDILVVLQAQARGEAARELELLDGCAASPSCAATVRASAARLRRPGSVKLLSVISPTAGSLTGKTGTTRVAWTVLGRAPVVQCVRVRHSGDLLSGYKTTLLSLSAPISSEGHCTKPSATEVEEAEEAEEASPE
jgi:hypothetical protein